MIDLTVGIATYNGRAFLAPCLESIAESRPACRYEIVVVDNASADGTAGWLQSAHPQVRLIANTHNAGVARANNQCLAAAAGRYVLLLNNDTLVLPGMLDRLVTFADEHPGAGAVGGKLVNPDGSFQSSYSDFPTLRSEFLHATRLWELVDRNYPSHGEWPGVREVDWMCSACLLVRKAAVEEIGTVDEAFFMYSDETDLQYRLRQAGWKAYYLPDVVTIHFGGGSASHWQRRKLIYRGKILFFEKHYGRARTAVVRTLFAGASALKALLWLLVRPAPAWRERAGHEISSNLDVLRVSLGVESLRGRQP